jgi:hypothetical protein
MSRRSGARSMPPSPPSRSLSHMLALLAQLASAEGGLQANAERAADINDRVDYVRHLPRELKASPS